MPACAKHLPTHSVQVDADRGETKNHDLRVSFTDKLKVHFKGSEVTSDGGLIAVRELDEQLGFTAMAEEYLVDKRHGRNIQHELTERLRQSVYSRLAGYEPACCLPVRVRTQTGQAGMLTMPRIYETTHRYERS